MSNLQTEKSKNEANPHQINSKPAFQAQNSHLIQNNNTQKFDQNSSQKNVQNSKITQFQSQNIQHKQAKNLVQNSTQKFTKNKTMQKFNPQNNSQNNSEIKVQNSVENLKIKNKPELKNKLEKKPESKFESKFEKVQNWQGGSQNSKNSKIDLNQILEKTQISTQISKPNSSVIEPNLPFVRDASFIKNFDSWFALKPKINQKDANSLFFEERQIWWCSIGANIGSEIDGKHSNFERPVLILKKFGNNTFLGVPMSTKIREGSYYFDILIKETQGQLLFHQAKTMDCKRLLRKIIKINPNLFNTIKEKFKANL